MNINAIKKLLAALAESYEKSGNFRVSAQSALVNYECDSEETRAKGGGERVARHRLNGATLLDMHNYELLTTSNIKRAK